MNPELIGLEIVGFIAGLITFSAQVPQVIKSWRTKSTLDISLPLYAILFCGIGTWIVYGYLKGLIAVFVMNVILEVLISIMLYLKLRYGMVKK